MKLILFAPPITEGNCQLNRLIDTFTAVNGLEIYREVQKLADRLREPQQESIITVLFASTKETLVDVLSIKDLLNDTRILLVLPDRQSETVAQGHMLRPRFVTYADGDFSRIAAVISKMSTAVSQGFRA